MKQVVSKDNVPSSICEVPTSSKLHHALARRLYRSNQRICMVQDVRFSLWRELSSGHFREIYRVSHATNQQEASSSNIQTLHSLYLSKEEKKKHFQVCESEQCYGLAWNPCTSCRIFFTFTSFPLILNIRSMWYQYAWCAAVHNDSMRALTDDSVKHRLHIRGHYEPPLVTVKKKYFYIRIL
jgi:hypothetical protein